VKGESGKSSLPAGSVVISDAALTNTRSQKKSPWQMGSMRQGTPFVAAVRLAGDWVRCGYVCEGKAAFDIQMILPVALGSSRLRPAVIYADAVAGSDPLHHAVEDLFSILTLIEAQITEVIQEAAG